MRRPMPGVVLVSHVSVAVDATDVKRLRAHLEKTRPVRKINRVVDGKRRVERVAVAGLVDRCVATKGRMQLDVETAELFAAEAEVASVWRLAHALRTALESAA